MILNIFEFKISIKYKKIQKYLEKYKNLENEKCKKIRKKDLSNIYIKPYLFI